jgi:DnaJ-class molecular chaperone
MSVREYRTTHIYIRLSTKIYSVHKTLSAAQGKGVVTTAMRKRKCNSCGGTGMTGFDFNNDAIYSKYCNGNGRID